MQIKDFLKNKKIVTPDMQREEIIRRMKRAGTYREAVNESTREIFAACKGQRTQKKVRNTFSREEAGTCGQIIRTKYFSESHITVTYKTTNNK